MYARLITFKADSGQRREVEVLADQVFGFMKSLQGFISVHFIISEDENEYGSFSLWESRDHAGDAGEAIRSEISGKIQNLSLQPPKVEIYEVYKPG